MANIFEEQAKERFRRSLAFMQKSHALLQDDLVYRSALADAVSAIKNMLQGYLLLRVSSMPSSAVTQRWQEIAISNRMPDLIQVCSEAGLNLHGIERDIKRLNNERNSRTHDDPLRLVPPDQAAEAYELALNVQRRIKAAVQGKTGAEAVGASPTPIRSGNSGRLAPVRAVMTGTISTLRGAVRSEPTAAHPLPAAETPPAKATYSSAASTQAEREKATASQTTPANAAATHTSGEQSPAASRADAAESEHEDDAPAADETYISLPVVQAPARRRRGSLLLRIAAAALLLVVGVSAGAGLMIPVARGAAPSWLGFASRLVGTSTVAPTATPSSTATVAPATGPFTLGTLQVTSSPCAAGTSTLTLTNGGAAPIQYAVGSADGGTTRFSVAASTAAQPGVVDTLAPGASVSLTVAGALQGQHLVVVTAAGTIQLLAPAC